MTSLFIIFLLVILLITLLYTIPARVAYSFDSNSMRMNLRMLWLYPLLKAVITNGDNVPVLTVHLFNKSIYRRDLTALRHKAGIHRLSRMSFIRSIKLSDVDVQTSYGFFSPLTTGIACGIVGIISQFVNIDSLDQKPDFLTDSDYVSVSATANLNLGLTLINLIRAYTASSAGQLSYQNR